MEHWKDMYDPAHFLRGGAAGHTRQAEETRRKHQNDVYIRVRRIEGRWEDDGILATCRRRRKA